MFYNRRLTRFRGTARFTVIAPVTVIAGLTRNPIANAQKPLFFVQQ
jgi:hypothetical protein